MKVASLHIYPVKSCQGIDLDSLVVEEFGPRHDREWLVVDEKGMFQTQRTVPKLAQIQTAITKDSLQLKFDGKTLETSLEDYSQDVMQVTVWNSEVTAHRETDPLFNQALSRFLGKTLCLVRYGPLSHREATHKGVGLGAAVRFADKTALLVTNQQSLKDLNSKLQTPIEMNRFRPNVVLTGTKPWEEDAWTALKIGPVDLEVASACGRCTMITIDQKKGVSPSKEPLMKLGEFRRNGNSIDFGVVVVQRSFGEIKLGDSLTLSSING